MSRKQELESVAQALIDQIGLQVMSYYQLAASNKFAQRTFGAEIDTVYLHLPGQRLCVGIWPSFSGGHLTAIVETGEHRPDPYDPDGIGLMDTRFREKVNAIQFTHYPVRGEDGTQIGYGYVADYDLDDLEPRKIVGLAQRIKEVATESSILPGKMSENVVHAGLTPKDAEVSKDFDTQEQFLRSLFQY